MQFTINQAHVKLVGGSFGFNFAQTLVHFLQKHHHHPHNLPQTLLHFLMTEPAALIIIALLIIITVIIIHIWMDKENVSMEITTSTIITPMMSKDVS